jgi:hypothetical protein
VDDETTAKEIGGDPENATMIAIDHPIGDITTAEKVIEM